MSGHRHITEKPEKPATALTKAAAEMEAPLVEFLTQQIMKHHHYNKDSNRVHFERGMAHLAHRLLSMGGFVESLPADDDKEDDG